MKFLIFAFAIIVQTLFLPTATVWAYESNAVISPRVHVTVISDIDSIVPGKPFHLGLRFQLAKGWHVYWLNPGDAGQPPAFHLNASKEVNVSDIEWPTPVRLREGPAMVFAYLGDTTLPFQVVLPASFSDTTWHASLDANWLVCADHCVPEKGHFDLVIPVGQEKISREKSLIDASLARVPQSLPFSAFIKDPVTLVVQDKSLTPDIIADAWFFPDKWGRIDHAAPQKVTLQRGQLALELERGALLKNTEALSGILVMKDRRGHESYYNLMARHAQSLMNSSRSKDWGQLIFFALLGGLILNLMPCVFPVLAMKALSILHLSSAKRHEIRKQALFYTAGVLLAFSVIAFLLIGLRTLGQTVGWGFQFQSPLFVTLMTWLLFAVGLNLSGVYTIGMRIMGVGTAQASKKGWMGSFFTGLLAVIVATPCVAPFLGTAIAAALTTSLSGTLILFLAMGFGLALPYVLLSLYPSLVRFFPRPGQWMEILRQFLAFPMYGAATWLLWVLSRQEGGGVLIYALTGMVVLGLAFWLYGQVRPTSKTACYVRNALLFFVCLSVVPLLYEIVIIKSTQTLSTERISVNEEPYTEQRLAELRKDGQPVFVDMTAAWCITCLVNERVAIMSDTVQTAFQYKHIAYLKGDWTQQDLSITRFLEEHGTDGVPLYVFYPAQQGEPVVLPQILTASIVLDTINPPQTKGD